MTDLADCTLSIQVIHEGGVTRVVPNGELDASSARTFETAGRQALQERPTRIELDLHDVRFIDSTGLRVVLGLTEKARSKQVVCVVTGLSPAAQRVLEITELIGHLRSTAVEPA